MDVALEACSSVAERCYYMAGVGGSIPSAPIVSKPCGTQPGNLVDMIITRLIQTGFGIICLLLVAACSGIGPSETAASATGAAATADTADGTTPEPGAHEYVIGAGDTLGISVYHAPELSVPGLPVRPDGRISMPLIPDIVAAGKTPTQLGKELEGRLQEYIKDPIVTVMVTGFIGPFNRQVRVIGEATEPSAIPYRDHMTVLDLMIAVKGLTKYAAGNSAIIVRGTGAKRETIRVHLSDLIKYGDIDQNVEMLPGDTLIIPQSWF
jgi:polysaccharide biosynthesis/export protein